jgi:glutathione synthase/RimK-type ligase-like ATP-grasp enzyme
MTPGGAPMILLLTQPLDEHADHVAQKLRERGADFVRFNPAQFPTEAEVSLAYPVTGQVQYTLRLGQETIRLDRLQAIWYRRPEPPVPHEEVTDKLSREYVQKESETLVRDLWSSLDCVWVPALPSVIQRAQLKASQLKVARILGFEIPPTLFTNSPVDFLEFYRQHNGNIVSKLAGFSFLRTVGTTFSRYTEVVSKRDVGYAHAVRYCPVILQAYVPKQLELRITVVRQKVFAAEIHSQQSNHTRHDWRRYDLFETPYFPHRLPQDVAQRCVQLVEQLGLCYGAIDMVLTPDGRYVFLEINPNGQYLWIEDATGLPISDAICDLLVSGAPVKEPVPHIFQSTSGGLR